MGTLKYFRTVGAISMIDGSGRSSRLFVISTPAVMEKSYPPWSPLHFFMFGYTRPSGAPPSVVCHDTR